MVLKKQSKDNTRLCWIDTHSFPQTLVTRLSMVFLGVMTLWLNLTIRINMITRRLNIRSRTKQKQKKIQADHVPTTPFCLSTSILILLFRPVHLLWHFGQGARDACQNTTPRHPNLNLWSTHHLLLRCDRLFACQEGKLTVWVGNSQATEMLGHVGGQHCW